MIRKTSFFFELKATLTVTSTCQIMPSSFTPMGRQKICNRALGVMVAFRMKTLYNADLPLSFSLL